MNKIKILLKRRNALEDKVVILAEKLEEVEFELSKLSVKVQEDETDN